jgi:hypothetical protein
MTTTYDYNYSTTTTELPPEAAGVALAIFGGFFLIFLLFVALVYVYMAVCLMKLAKKTNTPNAWFAWIPILNMVLLVQISKKPMWWIVLFFVPFANIVAAVMVWMAVAEAVKKPNWLGILMIVPVANFIVPGYLAFSKDDAPAASVPQYPVQ